MKPTRPASVLVIAILHFIFGGFGLLCGAISTAQNLAGGQAGFMAGMQDPKQVEMQKEMEKEMQQKLPNAKTVELAETGAGLFLSVLMIAGGVGLLRLAPWGRTLSILYAVLSILLKIAGAIYAFGFMLPVMREILPKHMAAQMANQPGPANQQAQDMALKMTDFMLTAIPVLVLLMMIYPIVVLIIMLRPKVAAAFRGEAASPQIEDYYDTDRTERLDQP